MGPMANIVILLQYLRTNKWHITAFQFAYKRIDYIVLFEDIENLKLVSNEYIVLLTFIDRENENHILQVKANQFKFEIDARRFREFFGIEYAENLGDVFRQFYTNFNNFIPQVANQNFDDETKNAVINRLNHNDNDNNICCYAAKRNGRHNDIQYHRTPFNSDKTRLLRRNLFDMLGGDDTVSFCYRAENPLSDADICDKFRQQYGIKN